MGHEPHLKVGKVCVSDQRSIFYGPEPKGGVGKLVRATSPESRPGRKRSEAKK